MTSNDLVSGFWTKSAVIMLWLESTPPRILIPGAFVCSGAIAALAIVVVEAIGG